MKWAILAIVLVGFGLLLGAPFIEFLAPSKNIVLVNLPEQQPPVVLARGAETLWYQWQAWFYIALFSLILVLIFSIAAGLIKAFVDQKLLEKKQKLDWKIAELKRSQLKFEKEKTREIEQRFSSERNSIEIMTQEALDTDQRAMDALARAERINKATNISHRTQNRENRSKLAQRDRLRSQKMQIAAFLDEAGWKFPDGSLVTYAALAKLGKQHAK